jgi:acetyl esterase/lipase
MDDSILDAELLPLAHNAPVFELSDAAVAVLRTQRAGANAVVLSDRVERSDHVVSADPSVVVRVHRPVGFDAPMPCVFAMHGGGYVTGTFDMDDAKFDRWCPLYGCVGVSVEYRLAPETPLPRTARRLLRRVALDRRARG